MSERRIDPERVAALLDGRLDARARAELLAELDASPADLEAFADAAAVLAEAEPAAGRETRVNALPRASSYRRAWVGGALAAGIAGIALITWMRVRTSADASRDPGRYAALALAEGARGIADPLTPPWSATRSDDVLVSGEARAARIGVLIADYELARRAGDPRAAELATSVAARLVQYPAGAPHAEAYRALARRASEPPESLEDRARDARVSAAALAGAEIVELAAWAESARIAAGEGRFDFFESRETREVLERSERLTSLSEASRAVVSRVRALAERSNDASARAMLRGALGDLLAELTR